MKATKMTRFFNPNENKVMHNPKFRLRNKKNKNKNTTCVKNKLNKILLQRMNRTKL
jgi:hypothetical protein